MNEGGEVVNMKTEANSKKKKKIYPVLVCYPTVYVI